jgi:hypothetical protein
VTGSAMRKRDDVRRRGVGVRRAPRVVLPAAQHALEGHIRRDGALHDTQLRQVAEGFQPAAPGTVLERGLRNGCYPSTEQQPDHFEEDRARCAGSADHPDSARNRQRPLQHAFLDLVPADRGTAHRLDDLVRQGGLARASGTADHSQHG